MIDVGDLDEGLRFSRAALHAIEEPVNEGSEHVYRRLVLSDPEIRVLLQLTSDEKQTKSRMHLDIETDDVEAEVHRLEGLGATRASNQTERGYDFWVVLGPWGNELCVLQLTFAGLLASHHQIAIEKRPAEASPEGRGTNGPHFDGQPGRGFFPA